MTQILRRITLFHWFDGLSIIVSVVISTLLACEKIDYSRIVKVETGEITSLTATSVKIGGTIIDTGEHGVSRRGHCWAKHEDPSVIDDFSNNLGDTTEAGEYTSVITGLDPDRQYFIRAYAFGEGEIVYGKTIEFTTKNGIIQITTSDPGVMTMSSVDIGGNIIDDGGLTIIERGICWNTAPSPGFNNNRKSDVNNGTGEYSVHITDLTENNISYYFRAYAVNDVDTFFGSQKTVTLWLNSPGPDISDVQGNNYSSVRIGSQVWMAKNLRTTRLNDNTPIDEVADNANWQYATYPAYCWYNNEAGLKDIYGALYNWYTVNTEKLCPSGWHIPDYNIDWYNLIEYLGGSSITGQKIKEEGTTYWADPNCADNQSGFSARPGGLRYSTEGAFGGLSVSAYWWSSSENMGNNTYSYSFKTDYNLCSLDMETHTKSRGFSVRCIKD
jgi:uncharacterized protein (TIGR02145 family)